MSRPPVPLSTDPDAHARVCSIIASVMIAGVLVFVAMGFVIRSSNARNASVVVTDVRNLLTPGMLIPLLGLVFCVGAIGASMVVPDLAANSTRRAISSGKSDVSEDVSLRSVYQTRLIVGLAIPEGAAFFNAIGFLLTGSIASLLAVIVLIALMVARWPSRDRIDDYVTEQAALLVEERRTA